MEFSFRCPAYTAIVPIQPPQSPNKPMCGYQARPDLGHDWQDRAHFFAIGAQLMRRILIEAARARSSEKRGGHSPRPVQLGAADLEQVPDTSSSRDRELVAIDEALDSLAKIDPRKAQVIELRFFGGVSVEDTAQVLKVSPQTVMRDWKLAKNWLTRELKRGTRES